MSRGHRARHEFVMERAAPPERSSEFTPTPQWSELRVIRKADKVPSLDTEDWTEFLNDLGARNLGVGHARALGSVAMTFIPATEMGRILQEKYPDAYRGDPKRTSRLHRKISESINSFVDQTIRRGFDYRTNEMETTFTVSSNDVLVDFSNDLEDEASIPLRSPARSEKVLRNIVLPLADAPIPFNAGSFATSQLKFYGNDGMAVDLSQNELLSNERRMLLGYLKNDEGLDTGRLERDGWLPHATIFTYEQHIAAAELQRRVAVPGIMGFDAVQAVVTGRANPYFKP